MFDLSETAKRALGPHWNQRTPAEREEFTQLFAELLEGTYIARIDEYGGERIRYTSEKIDGDNAVVQARITTKKGSEAPVEARMIRRGDKWYIYDVLIENISLIANYRAQFDKIIRTLVVRRAREAAEGAQADGRAATARRALRAWRRTRSSPGRASPPAWRPATAGTR